MGGLACQLMTDCGTIKEKPNGVRWKPYWPVKCTFLCLLSDRYRILTSDAHWPIAQRRFFADIIRRSK